MIVITCGCMVEGEVNATVRGAEAQGQGADKVEKRNSKKENGQ